MPATQKAPAGRQRAEVLDAAVDPAAEVLELLLLHAEPAQDLVCTLLRSSKAAAARVAAHLAGCLAIEARPSSLAAAEGLAGWVRRHGLLLNEMVFEPCLPADEDDGGDEGDGDASLPPATDAGAGAGMLLAAALRDAAAAGGLRQLEAFTCRHGRAGLQLLEALPPGLTRLNIAAHTDFYKPVQPEEVLHAIYTSELRALRSGLRRLAPSLTDLRLDVSLFSGRHWEDECPVEITETLSPLTRLTSLQMRGTDLGNMRYGISPETFDVLPASLRRLSVEVSCSVGLDLRHLTALTSLDLVGGELDFDAYPAPRLPASLVELNGGHYECADDDGGAYSPHTAMMQLLMGRLG